MQVKTSNLVEPALTWVAAEIANQKPRIVNFSGGGFGVSYAGNQMMPFSSWSVLGGIYEKMDCLVETTPEYVHAAGSTLEEQYATNPHPCIEKGETKALAILRLWIAMNKGDTVEIPNQLVKKG